MKIFDIFTGLLRFARNDASLSCHCEAACRRGNPAKHAFTLAEIMVVLGVIGVLTVILLPAAYQSTPDENVIKFKKAHNTFTTTIRELVNSDQYYKDGDLGVRANGNVIDGTHEGDNKYFCQTIGEIINTKNINCSEVGVANKGVALKTVYYSLATSQSGEEVTPQIIKNVKAYIDMWCKNSIDTVGEEIILTDGVVFYQTCPDYPFGKAHLGATRIFSAPNANPPAIYDSNGFDIAYKMFCIDIDGANKGEDAFGYGIRADGKILNGKRADEWLEKGIQGED